MSVERSSGEGSASWIEKHQKDLKRTSFKGKKSATKQEIENLLRVIELFKDLVKATRDSRNRD